MEGSGPTSNVEAGPRQDVALVVVADQVVARRLPGGVESRQRHAEVGGTQHSVQRTWQRLAVQRPEQGAGVDAQVRVDPAAGRQVGAHAQDRVLGVDYGYVWEEGGADGWGRSIDSDVIVVIIIIINLYLSTLKKTLEIKILFCEVDLAKEKQITITKIKMSFF